MATATGEQLHTSGSFWELYDDAGADEKEPHGPEKPGTTSSRSGFLAGETSWSNRSSTLGLPPSGARGGRQGGGGAAHQVPTPRNMQVPSVYPVLDPLMTLYSSEQVRNGTMENAARKQAAMEGRYS